MSLPKKHIIIKDRVELYGDFVQNLINYIYDYYLDNETLNSDEDIYNHYSWCFGKVCDEFKKEEIDFTKNKQLKDYFYKYFYNQFYIVDDNQNIQINYFEKFWKDIFEIEKQNNKNYLNILIEIYEIFDKSIELKENILEIV